MANKKPASQVVEFTEEQKLELKTLNEYILLLNHQLNRKVGYIAEKSGYSLQKNDVRFDLNEGHYTVTPLVKKEDQKSA